MDNQKDFKQPNYDNVPFSDRQKDGLNGPVKQTKQVMYEAFERNGEVFITGLTHKYDFYFESNMIKFYSESGKLREIVLFDSENNERTRESYSRNIFVKNEHDAYRYYDADGKERQRTEYFRNDAGELIEIQTYIFGELQNRTVYQKNDDKRISTIKVYSKDNILISTETRIDDKNGRLKESIVTDRDGKITNWEKYKRTAKGHTKEIIKLDDNENVISKYSYADRFDSKGDYKYNKNKLENDNDPKRNFKEVLEFDHNNNWVQKKFYYADLVLMNIEIREIDYYGEEELKPYVSLDEWLSSLFDAKSFALTRQLNNFSDWENDSLVKQIDKSFGETIQHAPLFESIDHEWLAKLSKNDQEFSALGYYVLQNKFYPSIIEFSELTIDAFALLKFLIFSGGEVVSSFSDYSDDSNELIPRRYTVRFALNRGYLVDVQQIYLHTAYDYDVPKHIYNNFYQNYDLLNCTVHLYVPISEDEMRDEQGIEATIISCIQKSRLYKKPNKPEINMIETDSVGNFILKSHIVKDNFEIKDLNLHYGQDFSEFHSELLSRFEHETQGLVLFHGLPGTGKTYYIRHLLRELARGKKKVIYLPPNMVDHLADPVFITFLSRTIAQFSASASFCVLLIEDAEPLLATRTPDVRIQGVTNLLNMTDGLLNDVLKLQIICTFNVELNELDSALLRPGRLIARKEFKPLPVIDANLLAINLGVNHHFTQPTTLSEIYAKLQSRHTILHDED